MNKLATIGVGVVAVIALIIGLRSPSEKVVERRIEQVGALTGPDIPYNYLIVGGVKQWFASSGFASATNTVCALQSPVASSTLIRASAKFTTSSTTATKVTIAKDATAYATTTLLADGSIAAGGWSTIAFTGTSTTPQDGAAQFAGGQYVVVSMAGGVGEPDAAMPTYSPTGRCTAVWEEYVPQ